MRQRPGCEWVCELEDVRPDAVAVEALARLQLAARRTGCRVRLKGISPELHELIQLLGLTDVLPVDQSPA